MSSHGRHNKIRYGVKWDLFPSQGGFSSFLKTHVCARVYICIHVSLHMHICVRVWQPGANVRCCSSDGCLPFFFFKTKSQFLPGTHQFGQVGGGSEHPRMASLLSHHWDEKRTPPHLSLSIRRGFWWVELGFSCSHAQGFAG